MSKPATPEAVVATPPRPPDPDFAHLCDQIRRSLRADFLTQRQQEQSIIAAAQEYAAALVEKCARPAQRGAP